MSPALSDGRTQAMTYKMRPPAGGEFNYTVNGFPFQVRCFDYGIRKFVEDPTQSPDVLLERKVALYRAAIRSRMPDAHGYVVQIGKSSLRVPLNNNDYETFNMGGRRELNPEDPFEYDTSEWVFVYDPLTDDDAASHDRGWGPGWRLVEDD